MATTPTWMTLVVALIGVGGVVLTQHLANRREDARWKRERERERAAWARDDAARSYDHRRNAYVAFIEEFNRWWDVLIDATLRDPNAEAPEDFLNTLYDRLLQVQIFGTEAAARLAEEALETLADGVFRRKQVPVDVLKPLRDEVRRDLAIPSGDSPRIDLPDDLR